MSTSPPGTVSLGLFVCEPLATFIIAVAVAIWGGTCRFCMVKCCEGRGANGHHRARASIVVSCDIMKATLGTLLVFLTIATVEALIPSKNLWALLFRWLVVVIFSLPLALVMWYLLCSTIRNRIADGKHSKPRSIWRSLQCSGRYNPRQRLGLEDGDCLDYRVEEEAPVAGNSTTIGTSESRVRIADDSETVRKSSELQDGTRGGGEGDHETRPRVEAMDSASSSSFDDAVAGSGGVVAASVVPLKSWWLFQTSAWCLVQLLASLMVAGCFLGVQLIFPKIDPAILIGDLLEIHLLYLGCGRTSLGWAVSLTLTMVLSAISVAVSDAQHRYHGRLAHRALTSPTLGGGRSSASSSSSSGLIGASSSAGFSSNSLGGVDADVEAHDGTAEPISEKKRRRKTSSSRPMKSEHGVVSVMGDYL